MSDVLKTVTPATQGLETLVDKAMPGSVKPSEIPANTSGKDVLLFSKILEENQRMSPELIQSMGLGQESIPTIKSAPADDIQVNTQDFGADKMIQSKDKVGDILAEVNRGQLQMEGIMEVALSGKKFTPSELLAMQAGVYQIAQEMELTSKVFEQVNTAHRTLWNTNFQG